MFPDWSIVGKDVWDNSRAVDYLQTLDFTATIHLPACPQTVTLDGAAVTDCPWNETASAITVKIPTCGKTPRVLILN
jgi:hypothetical protein